MSPIAADLPRSRRSEATAIRRLGAADRELLLAHLLRLDAPSRRSRFAGLVSDEGVARYVGGALTAGDATFGLFADGTLRGVAELRTASGDVAEGAFSLEREWQGRGFGHQLFEALLDAARRRGTRRLVLQCLRENAAMQRIARRFAGRLTFENGEVVAVIHPPLAAEAAASRALVRLAAETGVTLDV